MTTCCTTTQCSLDIQNTINNPTREDMIAASIEAKEAMVSGCGALARWNADGETGRIPKDTYMVKHEGDSIDWSFNNCIPMTPEVFDRLWDDCIALLKAKETVYELDRTIGADTHYCIPTKLLTDSALSALFADTMFRPVPEDIANSIFADEPFTILALPADKIDTSKYEGDLRSSNGKTVDMVMAMDFKRKIGIVYGTQYKGCIKKMVFTALNYLLPERGILPLHCSANEGDDGSTALFLGLSGTGKTTLSNTEGRAMIGDDEHGWSDNGIANFEYGCYAKTYKLSQQKEPEIYNAVFTERPVLEHGCITENAMVYPNGEYDLFDKRFAENGRAAYRMSLLPHAKPDAKGAHPSVVVFLTADACGVLPPVAKLTPEQAQMWFLMGYTSKLAGTEAGITEPKSAFSRFFGGPFMPAQPRLYLDLFSQKIAEHSVPVYLVNTGWSGGAYGTGERMDISVSRAAVDAALTGVLEHGEFRDDTRFHMQIPVSCPGIETSLLDPRSTWEDGEAFDRAANKLASDFSTFFDANFADAGLDAAVVAMCPGK